MSDPQPTTTDAPLLELRDLTKHFPLTQGIVFRKTVGQVRAVDGVSFDLVGASCAATKLSRPMLYGRSIVYAQWWSACFP